MEADLIDELDVILASGGDLVTWAKVAKYEITILRDQNKQLKTRLNSVYGMLTTLTTAD